MTPIAPITAVHENPMPEDLTWVMSTAEEQPVHLYETRYGSIETVQLANWKIHQIQRQAGKWLIRRTTNKGKEVSDTWHGPFNTEKDAVKKYLEAHAPIEITPKDLAYYKKNDYWGRLEDGSESILVLDKWTGGTILTTNFIVVEAPSNPVAVAQAI